ARRRPAFRLGVGTVRAESDGQPEAGARVLRTFLAITQEAIERERRPAILTMRDGNVVAIQSTAASQEGGEDRTWRSLEEAAGRLVRLAPEWRGGFALGGGGARPGQTGAAFTAAMGANERRHPPAQHHQ